MIKKRYQPRKDGEFIAWAENIGQTCTENAEKWGLKADALAQLNTLTAKAAAAYTANLDHATKNWMTGVTKRTAFKDLKRLLSNYINALEANLDVPDAAIGTMGLRPRRRHAFNPLPVPDEAPLLNAVAIHGRITLFASVPHPGHPSGSLSHKGYYDIAIRYRIEGDTDWQLYLSTRLRIDLDFDPKDQGKQVRISAAWINPRLQLGPWSNEISALIN
jgi:hypothetical protein